MLKNQSLTKSINKNLSIDFANDNFCVFVPNRFPSANFKNSSHSPQNASSLFCAFGLKTLEHRDSLSLMPVVTKIAVRDFLTLQPRAGVCAASLPNPFWLKSAVKADFLTPEPNSQISATNGTFKLTTTGDTNLIGGNIIADKVALNIGGNLNLETLQDTYESNGSSFGINISGGIRGKDGSAIGNARNAISNFEQNTLGGGVNNPNNAQGQQNATPNFGVSVGMNETFIKKTAKASGIIELSTNDSTKTEAENLTNLLNTNSGTGTGTGSGTGTINIAGTITNNTQKEDINFTNADFSGYLDTNTISNTINSAVWLGSLVTEKGRGEAAGDVKELVGNLKITVNQSAKVIDMPLVAMSMSDNEALEFVGTKLAGYGGSFAKLSTQILGLNYLLDSGNSQYNKRTIFGLNNTDLRTAALNQYGFNSGLEVHLPSLDLNQDNNVSGYGQDGSQSYGTFTITDKSGNMNSYSYETEYKDLRNVTQFDLQNNLDYFLHGIYNTPPEVTRNAVMQLGYLQNYNPQTNSASFVGLDAPTKGLIPDAIENAYNFVFGKTPIASANVMQLREFADPFSSVIQDGSINHQNGGTIRIASHSNGVDRAYLGLLWGVDVKSTEYWNEKTQSYQQTDKPHGLLSIPVYDADAEYGYRLDSKVNMQFYGGPVKTDNLGKAVDNAGATMEKVQVGINKSGAPIWDYSLGHKTASGDLVTQVLGRNAIVGRNASLVEVGKSFVYIPKLFDTPNSPHSQYFAPAHFIDSGNRNFNWQNPIQISNPLEQ